MRPLSILILEDDFSYATEIEMLLVEQGYTPLPIYDRAELVLKDLANLQPDLIIADIYLKGKMNGIEFAQRINEHNIPMILITSNADTEVYQQVNGVMPEAFLVKPFNKLSLQSAIERAFLRQGEPLLIAQVMDQWSKEQSIKKHLFIRKGTSLVKVKTEEIDMIEADGNYCYIYVEDRKFALKISLRKIKERLSYTKLVQINRKTLLNFNSIIEVDFVENEVITTQRRLTLGNTYRSEVSNWINKL